MCIYGRDTGELGNLLSPSVSSVKLLSCVWFVATPWTAAYQAPPSMGFSRQEYWSGLPLPSLQASLVITNSWSLPKLMSVELVMPSNHLILCSPLLLLPSIFPSIRVFHNASALHITGPNYWSFSFSISPFKEYSGLISFQIDWFDLLAVQGTLKIVSNTIVQKHQFFSAQLSLRFNSYIHMRLLEES